MNRLWMRCAEPGCTEPGESAITDAGVYVFENVACLAHWPPGAPTKLQWLEAWIDAQRARLGPDPEPHEADEEDEENDDE